MSLIKRRCFVPCCDGSVGGAAAAPATRTTHTVGGRSGEELNYFLNETGGGGGRVKEIERLGGRQTYGHM